ncbi:MAG TPA: hypothetical protein VGN20_14155 [Mucilaginibacter sp.]|jgi:nucleoside phosphorylase
MASKYSRIKRATSYLKDFLNTNQDEYRDAAANLTLGQGWAAFLFDEEIYSLMANLEGSLYEELYPKLFEDNQAPDTEILDNISQLITRLEASLSLFKKVADAEELGVLNTSAGIVQTLVFRVLYQLKETLELAEEDKRLGTMVPQTTVSSSCQIAIITATQEEFDAVRQLMTNFQKLPGGDNDAINYYGGSFEDGTKSLSVILARGLHQGIAPAATVAGKLIWKFLPEYIVMLGHAAGSRKSTHKPNLGDIMIASSSVNYHQVVYKTRPGEDGQPELYESDRKMEIPADPSWVRNIEEFARQTNVLPEIQSAYAHGNLFEPLRALPGKLITGDALMRADEHFDKLIEDNAGSVGLDMETYGVYYAAEHTVFLKKPLFISLKSVSDYGGKGKEITKEQKPLKTDYAAYTSAAFFYRYSLACLPLT